MVLRHALLAAVIAGIATTASAQTPPTTPSHPPAARTATKDMPAPNAADEVNEDGAADLQSCETA